MIKKCRWVLAPVLFCAVLTLGIIGCFDSGSSDNVAGPTTTTLSGRLLLPSSESASRHADSIATSPAAYADVWLEDRPDIVARSDAAGSFSLGNVPLGRQILVACLRGTGGGITYKGRISTLVALPDPTSFSSEMSASALEVTLASARNYVTGRLLNPDGTAFAAGVRLSLWGETFSVASGGYFTSPPLPDGIATATIFVAGTTFTEPISIMAPFVSDVAPAYLEIRFAERGYNPQTTPCAALSSWKAGIQSNKCSMGETLEIRAEVSTPDKITQGKATITWEVSSGAIASGGDSLHALWTAPSTAGVATITVTVQEIGGMSGITRLPILVGINTPHEDPTHPTVTLKSSVSSPSHAALIQVEIRFSKPVYGFKPELLSLKNSTVKTCEKIDELYYVISLVPVNQGEILVSLASDTVYDKSGNGNLFAVLTIVYDPISSRVELLGVPATATRLTELNLVATGADLVSWKYKLDIGTWSKEIPITEARVVGNLTEGTHSISVTGRNVAGTNQSEASATTHTWSIDVTSPVVTVDSRDASETSPALSGTIDDASATVMVTIDRGSGGSFAARNGQNGFWTIDRGLIVPPLRSGIHLLSASATDPVGNVGGAVIPGTLNITSAAPVVVSVTSVTPDGAYTIDHPIDAAVNFSRPVISSGTAVILLDLEKPGMVSMQLASPSMVATTTHFFRYIVKKDDRVAKLEYHSRKSLTGEFADALGVPADLNLPEPGSSGSLGANTNIEIVTEAPKIMMEKIYANFSSPEIYGTVTHPSGMASISVSAQLSDKTYPATVLATGKWLIPSGTVSLANASYSISVIASDAAGNVSSQSFNTILDINTTLPTVSWLKVDSTNATVLYKGPGDMVRIEVGFSKPVIITGTASILLETGTVDRLATSTGEISGNIRYFQYCVQPGDSSNNLEYVSENALSGDIRDYCSSSCNLTLPVRGTATSVLSLAGCVIDTISPVLDSTKPLIPRHNTTGFDPESPFVVTFNESVKKAASGSISIYAANGSLLEKIPASSDQIETYDYSSVCRIFPSIPFASGATYKVRLDGPLVKDLAGNGFQGGIEPSSWMFTAGQLVPAIHSFRIDNVFPVPYGIINQEKHEITIDLPAGTSLSPLIPVFSFTGKSVSPSSGVACDFSTGSCTFTLTASDDSTIVYRVFASIPKSVVTGNVWLDVKAGRLYNTSSLMEYSLNSSDGGGGTWTACTKTYASVSVSVGNTIWVREITDPENRHFLGTINALSGPDYTFGANGAVSVEKVDLEFNFSDPSNNGISGEKRLLRLSFDNLGDAGTGMATVSFSLSSNQLYETSDIPIATISFDASLIGRIPKTGYLETNWVIPEVPAGIYNVIAAIDPLNQVQERTKGNNYTPPVQAWPFSVLDKTTSKTTGAFRFVNSWGVEDSKGIVDSWEKIPDGFYWMTYEAAKLHQLEVFYSYNTFNSAYKPVVIALFQPCHPLRSACRITFGLGDPKAPQAVKLFGKSSIMGDKAFPGHLLALDISEFSPKINDFDLFLKIENQSTTEGTLASFSVEFTKDGGATVFRRVAGENGVIGASSETLFIARTKDVLTSGELSDVTPVKTSLQPISVVEETPDSGELAADMQTIGVYDPGQNYDKVIKGKFHTGLCPPTREEWLSMRKLRSIVIPSNVRASLSGSVKRLDHSKTKFFPPIGNQYRKGSCTAFATTYYSHTFQEAKEHNWDLSGVKWVYPDPVTFDDAGGPDSCRDKIFSPDFIYTLINFGKDASWVCDAFGVLSGIGCCSWEKMPYASDNFYHWGSNDAWREAAKYRGREVAPIVDGKAYGYFIVRTDADIELLKSILKAGYVVTAGIDAYSLFEMTDKDVVTGWVSNVGAHNHAQVVVGFKEGDAWDLDNPDK
ncbi:MAG: Ig-like domain-containing protein [Candidatus Ozemobacteraceae bacterium]